MEKKGLKVLFISHEATRTGAPLVLLTLLKAIKKEHPQIKADLLMVNGGVLADLMGQYANIVQLHKKKNLWIRIKQRLSTEKRPYEYDFKQIKSSHYSCIFANSIASLSIAVTLKEELQCPLILYVHEASCLIKSIGIDQTSLYLCDKIIAASNMVMHALSTEFRLNHTDISVIYPQVINITPTNIPSQHRKQPSQLIVGLSGTGCWNKGIDLLPLVIKEFTDNHPSINCHFVWVGSVTDEAKDNLLFDLKKNNNLDKLTLTGIVDFPLNYYKKFDIFLLLSREESFSLACAENILLGTPVVCMEGTAGIIDMIGKDAAMIVPYLSVKEISDALYKLSTNNDLYADIANKAQKRLTSAYTQNNFTTSVATSILNTVENYNNDIQHHLQQETTA